MTKTVRRWMAVISLSLCLVGITACSMFQHTNEVTGAPIDPRVRAEQEGFLAPADAALKKRDFVTAEKLYADFQKKFPTSIFYQRAQFGLANAIENQGRWAEAAALYRNTVELTRETQPEIAAQALYQVSFCYENLGEEAYALAALNDALRLKDHLAPEIALAAIPARLAANANRTGRTKEAEQYLRQAEQGIQQIKAQHKQEISAAWLAQTYEEMGAFSTNQISVENLPASLDTLKMVQIFSLRSIEAQGGGWSNQASQGLIENYRDLWNTIQQIPVNKAMDPGAAKRDQQDQQIYFTGRLLSLITELRQYRSPEVPAASGELFSFLKKLEKQGQTLLTAYGVSTPLTPEAEVREGLKRPGITFGSVELKDNGKEDGKLEKASPGQPTTLPTKPQIDPNLGH